MGGRSPGRYSFDQVARPHALGSSCTNPELGKNLEPFEVSNYWLRKSLEWVQKNPVDFMELQAKKVGMFWSWYEWPDAVDYYYVKQNSIV